MPRIGKFVMVVQAALLAIPVVAHARQIPVDAPELAPRGPMVVGTTSMVFADPDRANVLKKAKVPGKDGAEDYKHETRDLPIVIWYPATAAAKDKQHIVYTMRSPYLAGLKGKQPRMLHFAGKAARNAKPASGRYPLVVLSHGYNNRALGFSHLGENLASKGFVVVSIEHHDLSPIAAGSRMRSFEQVLVDRSADQRFVIAEIRRRAASAKTGIFAHVKADDLALAGYSMGGYGAIATAGAGYDPHSPIFSLVPKSLMTGSMQGNDKPVKDLKAVILFGPWGGAPGVRLWSTDALARIKAPVLFIDGSRDDIADYATGTRWLFKHMTGSDRYFLTYREARHNIAMNAAPPSVSNIYLYIDKYDEPVWRKNRILAINAHMITAFLDWHLKGKTGMARFLDVPTPVSDNGTWPLKKGEMSGKSVATGSGETANYWPGFHRRWALGLELHHLAPGETSVSGTKPAS